ncbi:MAG: sugar transferase [Pseudomonadales bacterium]|nr:sugar transferase [Pseudomonadales bacterium]NRA14019.1 sugar transferase [Oceanospirillaceae bacterium]
MIPKRSEYIPNIVLNLKRATDIACALAGLGLGILILPVIVLCIKLESSGPIFFRQLRIGKASETCTEIFWMYKLRTMQDNAEKNTGAVWASAADPRITKVGQFLRKTRLDELPQLYNVLRGDMSIIGPRPERPGFYAKLERAIPYFCERTWGLKPGITGLAQVNQGYDRNIEDVRNKVAFDHIYALSLSSIFPWLIMDASILVRTLWVMISGRGQ